MAAASNDRSKMATIANMLNEQNVQCAEYKSRDKSSDAIRAAPRSPPPALSCEPEGRTTIVACFLACARRTPAAAATAIGSEFMKIMLSFASHLY